MSYYRRSVSAPGGSEKWKCSICGSEYLGTRIGKRTALRGMGIDESSGDVHSRCPRCGNVICGRCMEFQKPSEYTPVGEILCPECGSKFGVGPVLVPDQVAQDYDTAGVGVEAMTYVKDLKSWAGWVVFWSIINFVGTAGVMSEVSNTPDLEFVIPEAFVVLSLVFDVVAFISALACLANSTPWAGFYVIFSLYLLIIGLFNLFGAEGFWKILGIVQIVIALAVIGKGSAYSSSRTDTGRHY